MAPEPQAYSCSEWVCEVVNGVMFQLSRSKVDNRMAADAVTDSPVSTGRLDDQAADLRVLGLPTHADWDQICEAHASLVSDLTPGDGADHGNVTLAKGLLDEVNRAFEALQARSSVA